MTQSGRKMKAKTLKKAPKPANNQRQIWLIGGALVLLVVAAALVIASLRSPQAVQALPAEITVAQAYQKYQEGAFLLDVRTQEEWDAVHAPNTTLIPLDQLPNRLAEVPRDQEIVVVCRSGNRSREGRDILLNAGFAQVTSMSAGLNEWRSAGYPVVSGP